MTQRGKLPAARHAPVLPEYPQLWANVNAPPVLVHHPGQAQQLGSAWRKVDLTPLFRPLQPEPLPDVPPVSISPTSASPTGEGGSDSFAVTITGPGESGTWTVDKDAVADWLTVDSPTEPQTEDGEVHYTVAANTGDIRSAAMYVNGKTFTVNQKAGL